MRNRETEIAQIIVIIILLIGLLFVIPVAKKEKEFKNRYSKISEDKSTEKGVKQLLNKTAFNYESYEVLGDQYLVLKNSTEQKIFDISSGRELAINSIIKEDKNDDFQNLIKENLYYKYPKFIADGALSDGVHIQYDIGNDISISFLNVNTSPSYEGNINIILSCEDLKGIIKYDCESSTKSHEENVVIFDKTVALTFDDGPSNYTSDLVDTLNNNKAHATFFMLGQKMAYSQDIMKKVLDNDNEIGGHSYSHKYLTKIFGKELDDEFNLTNENYKAVSGEDLKLFRPPYGSINSDVKTKYNYAFILWSIDSNDWRHKDIDKNVEEGLNGVNDGDIILFHDTYETTTEAIKIILPELWVRGYNVVTVSQLANIKGKEILSNNIYRSFK